MSWLSIIGIGEDGREALSPAAAELVAQAQFILGGARHLALLGETGAETLVWPSPFEQGIEAILARRGQKVCVLASGDPFLYGVGSVLAERVPAAEIRCIPAPSSLSLAAARLGWALQDCEIVSLHGRPLERVVPHLRPGARILALSWDGTTPAKLAWLLDERDVDARITVLEALGGPREKISPSTGQDVDKLNLLAIEVFSAGRYIPLAPGLPDDWFETDGQVTKREIRAVTLSSLAPWPGALLWDIGAGSGSVAIEWLLAHPRNRAVAIEIREDRAARITKNAELFGVALTVVQGDAPFALEGLPQPDAIFVGGGGAAVIEAAWDLLPAGRRLVVNGVTVETQSLLGELQALHGGDLVQLSVARAGKLGDYRGWRPAMPVVQWVVKKP